MTFPVDDPVSGCYRKLVEAFNKMNVELKDRDAANLDMLAEVDELGKSPETKHEFRSLKQACLKGLLLRINTDGLRKAMVICIL